MMLVDIRSVSPDAEIKATVTRARRSVKRVPSSALEVSLNKERKAPNMSRMNKQRLVPFPSFDRCDSLLFFPSTFSKCVNSGDMDSLTKLITSRIDANCSVTMANMRVPAQGLAGLFDLLNQVHPDHIMVVHATKVIGNTIRAEVVNKHTDNLTLRKALERTFPDPGIIRACSGARSDPDKVPDYLLTRPEHERFMLGAQLASAEEVIVHTRGVMTLTFDYYTKHVTGLEMQCEVTAFEFM